MRLPRLYRLVRVAKLLTFFKAKKGGNSCMQKVNDWLSLNSSIMRLSKILLTVTVLSHIVACLWVFMVDLENETLKSWTFRGGYMDYSDSNLYLAALYWSF
jgi:succinate dehydrogenase/fumarate reductase cytochrome b subunit